MYNEDMENLTRTQKLLCYIIDKHGKIDDKVKLAKLQYFIDFIHFAFNDKPVSDPEIIYDKQKFGPLSATFNYDLNELIKKGYVRETKKFTYKKLQECDYDFDQIELKTIDYVLKKYGDRDYKELARISHDQVPYQTAKTGGIVRLFTAYNLVDEYPDYVM